MITQANIPTRRYLWDPWHTRQELCNWFPPTYDEIEKRTPLVQAMIKALKLEKQEWVKSIEDRCPICNNDTLEYGQSIYIDMGHYQQVDPDRCETCGYIQHVDVDAATFADCWERQFEIIKF